MAKTRYELLLQERDQLEEIIEHQFIERDICMFSDDMEGVDKVMEELSMFSRRKDAVAALIEAEEDKLLGRRYDEWQAIITITSPLGSNA